MRIARLFLALVLASGVLLAVAAGVVAVDKKVIKFGVNRGAENLDPVTQDANPDIWA